MHFRSYVIIILSSLLLSACNTIERRSEVITKSPLPALSKSDRSPKLLWSNSRSNGVGKNDAKLQLALTASHIIVSDCKGHILALNPETGRLLWEISTKLPITAGPTVVGDKVFLGTNEGQLLAYQLFDGKRLWQAEVFGTILAAPVANNAEVFVHVLDGSVIALSAGDGRQLWRYNVSTPSLMLRQSSSPVLSKNRVIVGFSNGKLMAFDETDGTPEWQQEISISQGRSDIQRMNDISADPIVSDNVVYAVSYQGRIAAVEVETGALIWERELSSYSGIAVSKQALYVSDVGGAVWAFNNKSGEVLWKETALSGRRLSAPALINDYVVVGDEDGYLHWLSKENGSLVSRVLVDSKGILTTPIVRNNIVYVLGQSGKVAAYSIPTPK